MQPKYKRVMLKLSGEVLAGEKGFGLDDTAVRTISAEVVRLAQSGVQVCIVVGAGNFWRGRSGGDMDRATADYMGMLATCMNALALQDAMEKLGASVRVQSAIEMHQVAETYARRKALHHLESGHIVIFACGTGSPFFSTDTAAALRAAEMNVDAMLLAKSIDAVYSDDPRKNPDAVRYDSISFHQILADSLAVIDSSAATICMDNDIPVVLFALNPPSNILRVAQGEQLGTVIHK